MNKITLTIPGYPHAISFIQETTQGQQKPVSAVESNPSISTDNYKTFSIYQKYFEAKSHEYYRKTNILHTDRMFLAYQNKLSAEGFLGTAKEIVKKAIRFAIMIIKNLINWVRGFIIAFARFVRDKIIYRVFGRPKSQKELEYYGAAYDQYCNLPISWTGDEEKSTEAQDESKRQGNLYTRHGNTPISYTNANKDIPELSPQERENLRYMHFKNDNFDTINRVSAVTAHAAASIQTSLLNDIKNFEKKKNVYRNYGIPYGNKELEATYRAEKDKKDSTVAPLYFYHDRYFMEFLYHIDKLTRGNLTSIAVGRREVLNDGLYGSAVERKLNPELGVTGREVAEAIILNCSLGNLQEAKKKAQAVNPDTVTIKDVLSKEVFLRIISGNRATLDRFSEEATETSKIANTLLETLEKFLAHLEDVNNELDKSNEVPVENYFLKDEMRTWMNFLVDFTLRFMNYRIDMIHVIIRVIKILNVKSHNRLNEKQSSLGYGQQYNSFLGGPIQVYRDNIFNEMSYPQLVKVSKYISDLQQRNMMYNSKAGLPIYVIPVKDGKDKIKDGLYQRYTGWATPIFKNDDKPFKEIGQRLLEFTCNEQKLITLFNTMSFNKGNPDEDLIGALIFADINDYNITTKEFKSFFPACIHYYAIIIHEVTHAVQNNIEIRKRVDYLNLGKSEINDNISEKIKEYKKKNHNYNKQESTAKTYHLNNKEAEAFKAQYNFYMTTLEDKPNAYQKDARNILIKNIFNRI